MSGFQRNGSPESSLWKTDVDNFQGYVRAKLEDLEQAHTTTRKKVSWLERRAQFQMGGLTALTTLTGLILTLIGLGYIKF